MTNKGTIIMLEFTAKKKEHKGSNELFLLFFFFSFRERGKEHFHKEYISLKLKTESFPIRWVVPMYIEPTFSSWY